MTYGTYLGGSVFDVGSHIAVDTAGAAYVTGFTGFNSSDFPTMNPIQGALRGGGGAFDAFVSKLSADGTSGTVVERITDPDFQVPTTVAKFGKSLLLPNARFGTPPTPDTDYSVARIDR